ncbi:hypothetical protein E4U59_002485 [Claviceps monticola]|nr:hypothetical protein E4U59_002485 [Claviceps monticola]
MAPCQVSAPETFRLSFLLQAGCGEGEREREGLLGNRVLAMVFEKWYKHDVIDVIVKLAKGFNLQI